MAKDPKVEGLEKSFTEMQDAIRRLSQECNSLVSMVAKLSEELNKVNGQLQIHKMEVEAKFKALNKIGATTY